MIYVTYENSVSRAYLERVLLPTLKNYAPIMDIGKQFYTNHYKKIIRTDKYVNVDIEKSNNPDIIVDIMKSEFVVLAKDKYPEYGCVLFNGVIDFGILELHDIEKAINNFHEILKSHGLLIIGWNEWKVMREELFDMLSKKFINKKIEGKEVYEPIINEEKHYYTCWEKL